MILNVYLYFIAIHHVLFDHVGDPDAYVIEFQDNDVAYAFTCLFKKLRDLFSEVKIKINKQDQ